MSLAWTALKDPWDGGTGVAWKRADINISDAWNQAAGTAQADEGMSLTQLVASCAVGLAALGICLVTFTLLRKTFARIYEPATYLVPERQQMMPPPPGWFSWIPKVLETKRSEFIDRAGLDAYCFVRFFVMQLKLYVPLALVVTPIVMCLNSVGVTDRSEGGLDRFAWGNLGTIHTKRYSGHLVMAIFVIIWFCYVIYNELIHYIEVRQAWMTSPKHRIRASATTVLVENIPDKWCSVKALDELFDVFPGGIRNIWVNRDFGDLLDKKRQQLELARKLENAETNLIRACQAKAWTTRKNALRKRSSTQMSRMERRELVKKAEEDLNSIAIEKVFSPGCSTGSPEDTTNLIDQLKAQRAKKQNPQKSQNVSTLPMKIIGGGIGAVKGGLGWGVSTVGKIGQSTVGVANRFRIPRPGWPERFDPDHLHHEHAHSEHVHASRAATAMGPGLENETLNLAADSDHVHHGPDTSHVQADAQPVSNGETEAAAGADVGHTLTHRHSDYLHKSGTPPGYDFADTSSTQQPLSTQRQKSDDNRMYSREFGDIPHSTPPMALSAPPTESYSSPVPDSKNLAPANSTLPDQSHRSHQTVSEKKQPELHHLNPRRLFRKNSSFPSPEPAHLQDDEYPITRASPQPDFSPSSATSSNLRHTDRAEAALNTDRRRSENVDEVIQQETEKSESSKKRKEKYAKMPKIINWEIYDAMLEEECESAKWAKHMRRKDRETMRMSLFPKSIIWWKIWPSWWPSLGKKVDVILYCRLQLLELNKEIARDEAQLEKFPLMNSAFIQFNHQAAAHMACQSITHHKPKNMGPRIIEMDPRDVIWDNLSITWWNQYIRTTTVIAIIIGIIITWAIPMAFVGLLSQLDTIATRLTWLHWVANLPRWFKSVIQGVLPPTLQALLLMLLPNVFRLLVEFTGVPTRVQVELDLQAYWFIFLFVQVFLVVTLSSGLTNIIQQIANSPLSVPQILAQNLPKGSNYFYSYMILQALTSSSVSLSQIAALFQWFVLGKAVDGTAREKFNRTKALPSLGWGTAFALHTNFTCITLVYSIIAPLMLVFGCIVSALYLIVQRYNCLFVNRSRTDSGGLYFPRAVNQTFTGIYVMILVLIGLFFLVRDQEGDVVCIPHAIVMIVVGLLVIIYHYMLNKSLGSLFTYVPITMEDEAQRHQDEFEKALERKQLLSDYTEPEPGADITRRELDQPLVELEREKQPPIPGFNYTVARPNGDQEEETSSSGLPPDDTAAKSSTEGHGHFNTPNTSNSGSVNPHGAAKSQSGGSGSLSGSQNMSPPKNESSLEGISDLDGLRHPHPEELTARLAALPEERPISNPKPSGIRAAEGSEVLATVPEVSKISPTSTGSSDSGLASPRKKGHAKDKDIELSEYNKGAGRHHPVTRPKAEGLKKPNKHQMFRNSRPRGTSLVKYSEELEDPEAARFGANGFLFEGYHDELEDLTPEERDFLVQHAFHHEALRMKKPAVWIPQDFATVSDDEVKRSEALCNGLGLPNNQTLWVTNEYSAVNTKAKVNYSRPPPDFNAAEEFMPL